jgi:hypothetical protein
MERTCWKTGIFFINNAGDTVNNLNSKTITEKSIRVKNRHREIKVIIATEGELITDEIHAPSGAARHTQLTFRAPPPRGIRFGTMTPSPLRSTSPKGDENLYSLFKLYLLKVFLPPLGGMAEEPAAR